MGPPHFLGAGAREPVRETENTNAAKRPAPETTKPEISLHSNRAAMTLKEIHSEELNNSDRIVFRKEGLFWKAFERSAYLLHLKGHDYRAMWMCSKEFPEGVVRVGTSSDPLKLLPECRVIENSDNKIVLEAGLSVVDAKFFEWRQEKIDNTTSMVRMPRKERRKIVEDPAMHRALAQMAAEAEASRPFDLAAEAASAWKDEIIDRIRSFDASVSVMHEFVTFVFSLKEAVTDHDRKEGGR